MKLRQKQEGQQISLQLKAMMNELQCVNGHRITRVCDNNKCESAALFCNQKNCAQCNEVHINCRSYSFQLFTKLVQKRSSGTIAEFLEKIGEKEQGLIEMIQKHKRKYIQSFMLDQNIFNMDRHYYGMIEDIYREKNSQAINGKQASELFQRLQETQIDPNSRQEELLETFFTQAEKVMKEYIQIKDWIYDSAIGHQKYKKVVREKKEERLSIQSNCLIEKNLNTTLKQMIDSSNKKVSMFAKIIEEELQKIDKMFVQDIFGISKTLKFQKVYTASQNDFRASRFHEVCDHIENTFIVIRNELGKTFGGFTSLTWFGDNVFKSDQENTSFLVSFDQNVKLSLFNRPNAIYCSQSLGPTFGGDNYLKLFFSYDLLIGDQCNNYATSYYEFPKSYQFHQRSTEPINIFGVQKGRKFKIVQYQVFKVSLIE